MADDEVSAYPQARFGSATDPRYNYGAQLLLWQAEARATALQPLIAPLTDLACRLLHSHAEWFVQEQVHLDHASLEVASSLEAAAILVECRRAEDLRYQDRGAVTLSLTTMDGSDQMLASTVIESEMLDTDAALAHLMWDVEHEVLTQARMVQQLSAARRRQCVVKEICAGSEEELRSSATGE